MVKTATEQGMTGEVTSMFEDMGTNMLTVNVTGRGSSRTVDVDESAYESKYTKKSSTRSRRSSSSRSRRKTITIKSGQTLSEIAEKYGTTVSKLRRLNGIRGSSIRAGKKLRVR